MGERDQLHRGAVGIGRLDHGLDHHDAVGRADEVADLTGDLRAPARSRARGHRLGQHRLTEGLGEDPLAPIATQQRTGAQTVERLVGPRHAALDHLLLLRAQLMGQAGLVDVAALEPGGHAPRDHHACLQRARHDLVAALALARRCGRGSRRRVGRAVAREQREHGEHERGRTGRHGTRDLGHRVGRGPCTIAVSPRARPRRVPARDGFFPNPGPMRYLIGNPRASP
ncbi:MAG: hypothetical protein U0168_11980 [Nannocystaceae bacterium]